MVSNKRLKCIFLGFGSHAQKYADAFKELDIHITSILVRKKKDYNVQKKNIV